VGIDTLATTLPSKISTPSVELEVKVCYKVYSKVEDQVNEFSRHFQKHLITECCIGIAYMVSGTFLFIRWNLDSITKLTAATLLMTFVAVYGKNLYDLGREGSQLTSAAMGISKQLCNLFGDGGDGLWGLNFHLGQKLQMFAMKIGNSPPVINVGEYFTLNRKIITTVNNQNGLLVCGIAFVFEIYYSFIDYLYGDYIYHAPDPVSGGRNTKWRREE